MSAVYAGGCHCGAVRYEATGPLTDAALCHCTDCRRVSGAPAMAWVTVPAGGFRFLASQPLRYSSSTRVVREFCGACGAQLTFTHEAYLGEKLDIATASLDDPGVAPPEKQIYVHSRLSWMRGFDALPERADASPSPGQ